MAVSASGVANGEVHVGAAEIRKQAAEVGFAEVVCGVRRQGGALQDSGDDGVSYFSELVFVAERDVNAVSQRCSSHTAFHTNIQCYDSNTPS